MGLSTEGIGDVPDLSDRGAVIGTAFYEWLLSDHPWALAERTRRREMNAAKDLERAATIQTWIDRTRARDAAGELAERPAGWRDNLVGLAESIGPTVAANHLASQVDSAEPDDVWVARERRNLETYWQVKGEDTYTYPAHLTGPGAAAYPPPGASQ